MKKILRSKKLDHLGLVEIQRTENCLDASLEMNLSGSAQNQIVTDFLRGTLNVNKIRAKKKDFMQNLIRNKNRYG